MRYLKSLLAKEIFSRAYEEKSDKAGKCGQNYVFYSETLLN